MDMPTGNKSTVNFDFHGRTALVTGAGRGVGEEIARLFHASRGSWRIAWTIPASLRWP